MYTYTPPPGAYAPGGDTYATGTSTYAPGSAYAPGSTYAPESAYAPAPAPGAYQGGGYPNSGYSTGGYSTGGYSTGGYTGGWTQPAAPTAAPPTTDPGSSRTQQRHDFTQEITVGWNGPPQLEARKPGASAKRSSGGPLRRRSLAMVLLLPALAGAAATVGLWAESASFSRLQTPSDLLIAGGRITGLLGAYLLLLQVTLMARIPWLERRIGSDWMTGWHRVVGSYLVSLLVLHALLLIAGYSMVDQVGYLDEATIIITSYPGVLMATVALALMVVIGASSARKVKAKLEYETWHFVHLYAYLAVLLGFAHQITQGADFAQQPLAQAVWTGAHVLVAVCVIAFRVVQPVTLSWRHKLRVREVVAEGDGVLSVYVTGYGLDLMGAQAGQFFRWRFMTPYTWWQAHPFSLSAAPTKRTLRLTIKMVGDHTKMLRRLRPGTPVIAEGPYGALTDVQRKNRKVLLLAGGIGITPIRALLEGLPAAPGDITVLFRGDGSSAKVFAREMETLARGRGALVHYLLGPRAKCCPQHDPLSPERITELVPDVRERDAYICGSPGMMDAARRSLRNAGIPVAQIHAERFEM